MKSQGKRDEQEMEKQHTKTEDAAKAVLRDKFIAVNVYGYIFVE